MEKNIRMQRILEMLEKTPGDSFLLHAMALEKVRLGEDQEAAAWFEKVLNADPGYLGSYYHYAKLLVRTNRPEEAKQWFRKGMDLAKLTGDKKTFQELDSALEEITE